MSGTALPTGIPIRTGFELLGIGATAGYELIREGALRSYTVGRKRFTTPEALREFIAAREQAERTERGAST